MWWVKDVVGERYVSESYVGESYAGQKTVVEQLQWVNSYSE